MRCLHSDLIWRYKILFDYVDVNSDELFELEAQLCILEGTSINCLK